MPGHSRFLLALTVGAWLASAPENATAADEKTDEHRIALGEGAIEVIFPENWQRKPPENRIVEFEFAVPASEGDKDPGRVTVMGAAGSIDDNIERWIGQFTQPDGADTHKVAKIKDAKVSGLDVHVVDISGTFKDSRGPFSRIPAVERPKYRMLATIISSNNKGNYFIKFTGGQQTVADNEKAFQKMIDSIKAN
jgi:hypothetical protein